MKLKIHGISYDFIKANKTYFFLISGVIMSSIALVIIIGSMFNGMISNINESNANKYGIHHAIVYDTSYDEKELLTRDEYLESYGTIKNLGYYNVKNSSVYLTIGSFDQQAIALSHIKVEEGRLPESNNEIAIEKNIMEHLDHLGIGSTIEVVCDNQIVPRKLTGILADYSGAWDVPEEIIQGKTDLPNAIVFATDDFSKESEHILLKYRTFSEEKMINKFRECNINPYLSIINTRYNIVSRNELSNLYLYNNIFFIILFITVQIIVYNSYGFFVSKIKGSFRMLRVLGASYRQIFKIYSIMMNTILIGGLVLGGIIGISISFWISTFLGVGYVTFDVLFKGIIVRCLILMLLNALMGIIVFKNKFIRFCRFSLVREKNEVAETMKLENNFISTLTNYNFRLNFKRVYPILFSICLIFFLIGFVNIYFNGYYSDNGVDSPDFIVQPYTTEAFKEFGAYRLFKTVGRAFDVENIELIHEMEGTDFIYSEVSLEGATIISRTSEEYWNQWTSVYDDNLIKNSEYPSTIPKDAVASNEYCVLMANPTLIELISQFYKGYNHDTNIEMDSVILFLPDYDENGPKIDHLQFAKLYIEEGSDFTEAISDTDYVKCSVNEVPIDIQINESLYLYKNNNILEIDKPTLVMPPNKIVDNPLFAGISKVVLYTNDDISQIQIEEMNETLQTFARGYSDSYFFSLSEIVKREKQQSIVINTSLITLSIILISFLLIIFYHVLYLTLYNRRRSFGIYRALGMDYKCMYKSIFSELNRYAFICSAIACALLYVLNLQTGDLPIFVSKISIIVLLYLALVAANYYASRRISILFKEKNIYNLIKYRE